MRRSDIINGDLDELEDPELIRRVSERDRPAFEILYKRYAPSVYRYLSGQIRQREIIDEAVDDVMMVVWERASTFNGTSKLLTWILAIAHNKALKVRARAAISDAEFQEADHGGVETNGPENAVAGRQLTDVMMRALGTLVPEQRAVVELTYYHDRSCAEIAAILKCPVNTVKTRMFHARQRLELLFHNQPINQLRGLDDIKS